MTTPLSILRDSIKAVPAVKYALGVAGIISVIAIIKSFNLDYRVAIIGTIVMLLLMTVLVISAKLSSLASPDFRLPALVFTWFALIFVIAIAISMFTSVFFKAPLNLQYYLLTDDNHDKKDLSREILPVAFPMQGVIDFKSDSGDFIGDGKNLKFTNADGKFEVSATQSSVSINFRGDDMWTLQFEAPEGKNLMVGSYESAQRASFHNPVKPGLDVSGAGRGCNDLTGRFDIHQIEYSNDATLERFNANFEQHCENSTSGLRGTVEVNAIR